MVKSFRWIGCSAGDVTEMRRWRFDNIERGRSIHQRFSITTSIVEMPPLELLWWSIAILLMAAGLIGTVLPVFPGTTIILFAAVLHRIMLGPAKSIGWMAIAMLVLLTLISYALDFAGGYWGARRFGASRWGMLGASVGAIIGIFFGVIGLFVGPVIGAIAGEFIAGKKMIAAGKAGWGSLLGTLGGMVGKLLIALAMIIVFLMTAPSPI